MEPTFACSTQVRMLDGSVQEVGQLKAGDQLIGDDNSPRKIQSISFSKEKVYKISYKPYVDSDFSQTLYCTGNAVLPVIPDGNRKNNMAVSCDSQRNYVVSYIEPVVDHDNRIIRVELKQKHFAQPDEALTFVDHQLPNFLFEPTVKEFFQLDKK